MQQRLKGNHDASTSAASGRWWGCCHCRGPERSCAGHRNPLRFFALTHGLLWSAKGNVQPLEREHVWKAFETAVIIRDMWDDHYCLSLVRRLDAMIPEMNRVPEANALFGTSPT